MSKIYLSIAFTCILFLSGCGTKRQYFEPQKVAGDVEYTNSLPSSIVALSKYGATLGNGKFITKDGLSNIKLDEGFSYFGEFDNRYISTNKEGQLHVMNKNGEKIYKKAFPLEIVSASIKDNILAAIDSSNTLYLVDTQKDKVYFAKKQDKIYAVDSRIAAPHFLNTLVIFPTLDGKLVIVDWKEAKFIRDVVLSSEPFFNNIIYLNVVNNRLVAATSKRAISIAPKSTAFFDDNIKDFFVIEKELVLLTQDGRVIFLDEDLKTKREHKFLFAVLLAATYKNDLYLVERNGYLIKSDIYFKNIQVYKFPEEIDELLFLGGSSIYYDDNLIRLDAK